MRKSVMKAIEQADDLEINEMVQAIIRRNDSLYPDNETIFLTLPKRDTEERYRSLDWAVKILRKEKFCDLNEIRKGTL